MGDRALVLLVRFKSGLSRDEAEAIVEERTPEFRALPGLQQKYYLEDVNTGDLAGLYLWDSGDSLESFRNSELRASIAEAYRAEGEPRVEIYRVFKTLREEEP
jgi:heme-degrading monooxygenase HmoA